MADEPAETWRIQLGVRPGLEDPIPEALLRSAPRSDFFVGDRSVIFYPSGQAEARSVVAEQSANDDVVWVELAQWDTDSGSWRTVETAGRRDAPTANTSTTTTGKWKPGTWPLMAAVFVVTAAVMFLLAYLLPGISGTAASGNHHNLIKSIAVGLFVGVICVLGSLFTTRRYEPPPP